MNANPKLSLEGKLTLLGLILAIVIPIAAYLLRRLHIIRSNYEMICKKSSSLKPSNILITRPFTEYYYERKEDILIKDSIINKKNILILGTPLAGKSRVVFSLGFSSFIIGPIVQVGPI